MPLRMVFRKPASTAPYTVGGELGHVSQEVPLFFVLCSPVWARPESTFPKNRRGLPSS